jgi:hypothetical protein
MRPIPMRVRSANWYAGTSELIPGGLKLEDNSFNIIASFKIKTKLTETL